MLEYNYREKEALQKQDFLSEFQAAALKAVDSITFLIKKTNPITGQSYCWDGLFVYLCLSI